MFEKDQISFQISQKNPLYLSKTISMIESTRAEDQEFIEQWFSQQSDMSVSRVLGITGPPGVGKSSFINEFVAELLPSNKTFAILSIDPSSSLSQGSILGDKTRMNKISAHPNVFIRPSPSSNELGGLGRKSHLIIELFRMAQFDYILVETVGVGQSEFSVKYLVDFLILLMQPMSGDELQGIKKGIIELADMYLISKSDLQDQTYSNQAFLDISNALHYQAQENKPVIQISNINRLGMNEVIQHLEMSFNEPNFITQKSKKRKENLTYWTAEMIQREIIQKLNIFLKAHELAFQDLDSLAHALSIKNKLTQDFFTYE
ncbi:MAG: hypothetical protein MUE53_01285 [Chitinophagales bacterium]|jgi:LAO/AO transport system kinase|nr:hypothetical protein [Chitinophagales bacterium]